MKKRILLLFFVPWLSYSQWTQTGGDIDGQAANDESGYTTSLSNDGTIVAIGAYKNDDAANNAGTVEVFQYSSGSWSQLGSDIDGEAAQDQSGFAISLNGDGTILAIGAHQNDGSQSGNDYGHVRVYEYSSGSWSQLGSDIDGESSNDYSGHTVSLSNDGTILAIGAYKNDGNGTNSGHVRVYEYSGSTWSQIGSDIDGEAANDQSGYSVSLNNDGTVVAIGAHQNDGNGSNSGHVRVYEYSGSSWSQKGGDIDGESNGDRSGYSVAINSDGTIVVIGANQNDDGGVMQGMFAYMNIQEAHGHKKVRI